MSRLSQLVPVILDVASLIIQHLKKKIKDPPVKGG